jgi:hypothetical protein
MSGFFRNFDPPPPHRMASVNPPVRGEDTLSGWRGCGGGGGQWFRKTPDTALYAIYVSTLWVSPSKGGCCGVLLTRKSLQVMMLRSSAKWFDLEIRLIFHLAGKVGGRGGHKVLIYIEHHRVCPLVGIVPSPPVQRVGGHTRLQLKGWGSPNSYTVQKLSS